MSWTTELLDPSFRGVPFEIESIDEGAPHALVEHSYPHLNGANIEGMGSDAWRQTFQIIFWGDDYLSRLRAFLEAVNQTSPGTLVHPIFGEKQCCVADRRVLHDNELVDACRVSVTFVEDGALPAPFSSDNLALLTERAAMQAEAAQEQAAARVGSRIASIKRQGNTVGALGRLAALRNQMTALVQNVRSAAQGIVTSALDVINAPQAWAADMAALADGMIDLRGFDPDIIAGRWKESVNQFRRVLRLPNDGRNLAPDQAGDTASMRQYMDVLNASTTVAAAGTILADAVAADMKPTDILQIQADVYAAINAAIATARANQEQDPAAVIEPLKNAAQTLRQAVHGLLVQRPPLVVREVPANTTLRLLAHRWYGDHERAQELLRLNPNLRQPNWLRPGDFLNAYAE